MKVIGMNLLGRLAVRVIAAVMMWLEEKSKVINDEIEKRKKEKESGKSSQ